MCFFPGTISGREYKDRLVTHSETLTLSAPPSRVGDKLLKNRGVCPRNGTAVLEGLMLLIFPPHGSGEADPRCQETARSPLDRQQLCVYAQLVD